MSPETETRMRKWAARTRAAMAAGEIRCPGDGALCERQQRSTGHHLHNCPLEAAAQEILRIERDLAEAESEMRRYR